MQAKIIVFDTGRRAASPRELLRFLPRLSSGSIYYHFIDAQRRTPRRSDDFSAWLRDLGPDLRPLADRLQAIDPYFSSLPELRDELLAVFTSHLDGRGDGGDAEDA
jgi:hypothetical protein